MGDTVGTELGLGEGNVGMTLGYKVAAADGGKVGPLVGLSVASCGAGASEGRTVG